MKKSEYMNIEFELTEQQAEYIIDLFKISKFAETGKYNRYNAIDMDAIKKLEDAEKKSAVMDSYNKNNLIQDALIKEQLQHINVYTYFISAEKNSYTNTITCKNLSRIFIYTLVRKLIFRKDKCIKKNLTDEEELIQSIINTISAAECSDWEFGNNKYDKLPLQKYTKLFFDDKEDKIVW